MSFFFAADTGAADTEECSDKPADAKEESVNFLEQNALRLSYKKEYNMKL
jgi:hypothetical protein